MDGVGVGTHVDEVGRIQFWEGLHLPRVSVVQRAVVQQRTVLTLVLQTTIRHRSADADDVDDFVVQATHSGTWPKVAHRGAVVEKRIVRKGVVVPRTGACIAAHHVESRFNAGMADDHFTAVAHVVDRRPTDADVFHTLVGLLAPHVAVKEVVAGAAVLKRADVQAHDPCGAHRRFVARHAVVDGGVGLKVVLGQAQHLTLDDEVARLNVVCAGEVLGVHRRFRTVIDVQHRVGGHGRLHSCREGDLRGLLKRVLLGKCGRSGQQTEREKGKLFHQKWIWSPK